MFLPVEVRESVFNPLSLLQFSVKLFSPHFSKSVTHISIEIQGTTWQLALKRRQLNLTFTILHQIVNKLHNSVAAMEISPCDPPHLACIHGNMEKKHTHTHARTSKNTKNGAEKTQRAFLRRLISPLLQHAGPNFSALLPSGNNLSLFLMNCTERCVYPLHQQIAI